MKRKIVFDYDPDPDMSWIEPPDKHENHIAIQMLVYEFPDEAEDWVLVDSLGGIDFLAYSNDWKTGTFYHVSQLPEGYLRDLAREAGLPE